jgi:CheY-like chemotaxis protein
MRGVEQRAWFNVPETAMRRISTGTIRLRIDGRRIARTEKRTVGSPLASSRPARCIQIVDDDELIRDLLGLLLRPLGYAVHVAPDAFAALWSMRQQPVDLLITDLEMPFCGGIELARRARELWPRLPVLFITGGDAAADCTAPFNGAPCALLRKPFSVPVLANQVNTLIAEASARAVVRLRRPG